MKTIHTQTIPSLNTCKSQIEEKLGWGPAIQWASQDFEMLSEMMLEATGEQISATTLKRVWGRVKYQSAPSTHTLNTLAIFLGFQNWRAFTQQHPASDLDTDILNQKTLSTEKSRQRKTFPISLFVSFGLVMIALIGMATLYQKESPVFPTEGITFYSNPVTEGVPNTVIFNYDVSEVSADRFSIQQSWDSRRRTNIESQNHTHTSVYYYPGYFRAKLVANDQIIKEHDVYVESDGWLALLAQYPIPVYLPVDTSGGMIRTDQQKINEFARNNPEAPIDINYYLVQDFGEIQSNDFHLSASLRNTNTFPEGICRQSRIVIMCSEGRIDLRFSDIGCVGELIQIVGDTVIDGKTHDLSAFGGELDQWTDVEVMAENNELTVRMNQENIFSLPMKSYPGKIVGLRFRFEGGGEVDRVNLREENRIN